MFTPSESIQIYTGNLKTFIQKLIFVFCRSLKSIFKPLIKFKTNDGCVGLSIISESVSALDSESCSKLNFYSFWELLIINLFY